MASKSETGHAKNVSNFETLILHAKACGEAYKPSKEAIKIPALNTRLALCQKSMADIKTTTAGFNIAKAARREAFTPLNKLITRVISSVKSSEVSTSIYNDAMFYSRKIKGQRASAKKTDEQKEALAAKGKSTKEISAAQTSFDNRIDNFDELITLLQSVPQYAPNEEDLKITALVAYLERLKQTNKDYVAVNKALTDMRAVRNELLYSATGLVNIAGNVKSYMLSAFGTASTQYKQALKLKFVNPIKK